MSPLKKLNYLKLFPTQLAINLQYKKPRGSPWDLDEPTHTLVPYWMPKPLPPRNQCTGWFAPTHGSPWDLNVAGSHEWSHASSGKIAWPPSHSPGAWLVGKRTWLPTWIFGSEAPLVLLCLWRSLGWGLWRSQPGRRRLSIDLIQIVANLDFFSSTCHLTLRSEPT